MVHDNGAIISLSLSLSAFRWIILESETELFTSCIVRNENLRRESYSKFFLLRARQASTYLWHNSSFFYTGHSRNTDSFSFFFRQVQLYYAPHFSRADLRRIVNVSLTKRSILVPFIKESENKKDDVLTFIISESVIRYYIKLFIFLI